MTTSTLRASYSISAPTLKRFNATIPPGERSKVVERFMRAALAERESALEKLAQEYMSDPAFAQCRKAASGWDATLSDGLEDA